MVFRSYLCSGVMLEETLLSAEIAQLENVVAIQNKKNNSNSLSNLRPISLLSNVGKVFEKILNNKLVAFCMDNNIISEYQFCFKKRHSTIHAISKLTSDINWALNNKESVGACLMDVEKSFDTVWHEGLILI